MKRVGVLGVGLISAGGDTLDETWQHVLAGQSSCNQLPARFAGHVRSKQAHVVTTVGTGSFRLIGLAALAIDEALAPLPANVPVNAIIVGSTSASFSEVEQGLDSVKPRYLVNALAMLHGIPMRLQVSQACSSSSYAIALGADMIRYGYANVVLAGGADELTPCVLAAFESVRIHTKQCRPFDKDRRGLTLGEAAAFVLLARPDLGKSLCYLDGIGLTCDAHDSVAPSKEGIARAITEAVQDAEADEVDFVVAHGTGTRINDVVEAKAIRFAMVRLGLKTPIVASYKGSLGHPQGASGAVGVALAVKALQSQTMFPTAGFQNVDPEVAVEVVTYPIKAKLDKVLCLSSGTWGTNAAVLLSRT